MSVNFHIKTKNMDLTPDVSAQVHSKLDVIEKFLTPHEDLQVLAEVEVGIDSTHHQKGDVYIAEVNVTARGDMYRASAKGESVAVALDKLKDEISRVISRSENKKNTAFRRGSRLIKKMFTGK